MEALDTGRGSVTQALVCCYPEAMLGVTQLFERWALSSWASLPAGSRDLARDLHMGIQGHCGTTEQQMRSRPT